MSFPERRGGPAPRRRPVRRFLARGRLSPAEALEARRVLATITVDSLADNTTADAFTTLREAMTTANASAEADTIVFASSLFTGGAGTITLGSGLPTIAAASTAGALTITGPGAATLTITANNGNFRVFQVASGGNASLSGMTVTGVNSTGYGAIQNAGTLAIDAVTVSNNYAGIGAAGILSQFGSTLTVTNSLIANNTTPSYGGGLRVHGTTTITNTVIAGNAAGSEGGGGLYNFSGNVSISNSTIRGNRTGAGGGNNWGGGLASTGTMTIDASEISENAATGDGGGVYSNNVLTITNSTISGNRASGVGGGIINRRTLSVTNSTVADNSAATGGGVYNDWYDFSNITIVNTILGDNRGGDYGASFGTGTNGASTNNLVTQGSFAWATTVTSSQLNLGVLQNNGGPTRTQALVTGSAAISSTVLGTPTLDQRGFTRTTADIGAYSYNYAGADGLVVSQNNEKQVVLTLPATASLSDLQVAYDSGANTVTITPVAAGFTGATTFVPSGGISGVTAGTSGGNKTVVVDLATQTGFGGIAVVTTSGTGATTLSGAVDLSLITGGAANQSITLSTLGGAASTSSLSFASAIKPKGSGSVTLGAGSISGSATLVASSVSANAATGMTLATQATGFGRIGNLASGTTTITQTGAAVLSAVVVKGDLALTSTGAMTQAGVSVVSVTGTSVFDSGGAAVTLNSAMNDFTGGVTVNSSAASVSLRDANALTISSLSLATNAAVTAVAGTTLVMPAGGISTGTGNIELQALGSAFSTSGTITTTSGSVSLYGGSGLTIANNITSTSGSISLTGSGVVVNAGVTVNAGSGTILVDGNDGNISLAGALTTTSNANNAVVIQDSTTVSLGAITTGATGTLRLGYGDGYSDKDNGDRISGLVTQTGVITAGTLTGYVAAGATLTAANAIGTISGLTSSRLSGNFTLSNTVNLLVYTFTNQWGNSAFATTGQLQFHSITADLRSLSLTGVGVSAFQSMSSIWSGDITVNGGAGIIAMGTRLALNGTLSLNNTGAFDVSANVRGDYPGDGWVRLGTSSIGGNLSLSGHGIVQTGALTVGGNATFTTNVSGYDIDLGSYANDLAGTVTVNSAGNLRDFKLRNVNASAGAVTNLTNAAATQLRDLSIIYPNAAYALPSLRQSSLRNVVVSAGGAITQASGGIAPTGTSSFTTGGYAITLTDAANDFGGAVALTNTGANAVAITDVDDLQFAASSVGSGTLAVTAVGISQSGAITQASGAGTATFNGGAGAIQLTQAGNEFTGAVSLTTTGTSDAAVTDATALILGSSSVGRNLSATATAFSQSGGLTVAGTTALTAAAAATDIDLATQANDLGGTVTVNSAANVRDFKLRNVNAAAGAVTNLTNAAATSLRDLSILYSATGYELPSLRQATLRNVVVSAGGAITQAAGGITPTGTASFTTGGFAIALADAANDFGGAVALTNTGANAVAITDVDDLQLAASSVGSGTLTVTAVGITQSGALTQAAGAGTATFNGGAGAIQLTQPGNEFTGAVSVTTTGTSDAAVTDATALILGTSSVGRNLSATATGFSQSGGLTVAGTTTLTAAAAATDIDLATQANDLGGTVTVNSAANVRDFKLRNVNAAAGAVTNLTNAAATSLRDLSILYSATGYELPSLRQATLRNVVVSAGGAITQAAGGITPTGTSSFTTGGYAITLTDGANSFGGAVSLANTGANDIDVTAAGGFTAGVVTTGGDVTITAAGTITVSNAITASGRTVTLDSTGGAVVGGGLITAGTVDLDAETGIGATAALTLAAASISADSTAGPVRLANALATAVRVSSLTSKGTSDPSGALLSFSQSGGGTVTFNTVSSAGSNDGYGVIALTNTGVGGGITVADDTVAGGSGVTSRTGSTITLQTTQGGNILVDTLIDANIADGRVELFSDGSISVPGLITGGEALLQAQTGIDVNASMPSGFGTISSPSGNIRVINQFDIGVKNVISTSGDVTLIASYDIILTSSITATGTGKKVTLTAAGGSVVQQPGNVLVTADIVDLNASAGIGSTGVINVAALFVSADTTAGAIDIDNTSGTAVSVTSLTTSGSAAITFDQTGAGGIGIDGPVTTGTGTITLTSQQGITGTGLITTGGTLNATAPTGLSLTTAVATLGTISVANGQLAIVDAGTLTVAGPVTVGSHASITATGGLMTITGSISNAGSDLILSATGIDQTGGAITTRNATISGNGGNIALNRSGNNFTGSVAITNTGSATTAITDANAIQFGAVSVGTGTFTVNSSGNITQKVATGIITGGAVVLDPGTGWISFGGSSNDFGGAVSATTTAIAYTVLTDSNSIQLGAMSVGSMTVTSVGVTQDASGITVAGNVTFDAGAGAVTLTDPDNDFQGRVSINTSGANNVAIRDRNAIEFGATALGSGTLAVTAVGITQAAPITQTADAGTATFNGGAGPISLTNPGNNFRGSVAANTTGANAIQITDADALVLGGITTADALTVVTGDDVTQAAGSALDVTGATNVTATGFAILLTNTGNDLSGAVSLTGRNVAVRNSGSLLLGPATASGTYAATALSGDITQQAAPAAGISATGAATFTANGTDANIILDNPTNAFGARVNIVAGDANDVTIVDAGTSQLTLAAIAINGNLLIRSNGVTQLDTISVAGTTSITSTGGNIDLGSPFNDFDTVEVNTAHTPANVILSDADVITFLDSTLGTGHFDVNAEGIAQTAEITQEASAGAVSLVARAGTLVLDHPANSFTGTVSASTTHGNAIRLTNSTAITLGTVTADAGTTPTGGDITITAQGVGTTGGADSITTTGDILLQPLSRTTTIGVAASGAGIDIEFAQALFNTAITSGAASITIGQANQSGQITVGAVTFRDPTIIRSPGGSVTVAGQITGADDASITISASANTVTLGNNIVTAGNAITIDDGSGGDTAVVLGASVVLDTTNGGSDPAGAAITIRGTVTGDALSLPFAFQIKAGTDGDLLVTDTIGAVGAGVSLASLIIAGNDITLASIDGVIANTSIDATDGTDTGSITLTAQTYATGGGLNLSAGLRNGSNVVSNPITLTGGAAGATTTISSGGNLVELSGAITLNQRSLSIDTTGGGSVSTGGAVLINDSVDGVGALRIDAGTAGTVDVNHLSGAVGGTTPLTAVTLTNAGQAIFVRDLAAGTVTVTDATNYVQFSGLVDITTGLVTAAQPYDLKIYGGGGGSNTIAGTTTFLNTGDVELGDVGNDVFTFSGGVVATAPAAISISATIAATTGVITLGDSDTLVTVVGAATVGGASTGAITLANVQLMSAALTLGTGVANTIQVGSITGGSGGSGQAVTIDTTGTATVTGAVGTDIGAVTITNSGGTTFQSTVDAALVTITDTTGTVAFQGALTATGLTTATKGYAVALLGNGSTITSAATFANTGGVTLGNGGDVITFDGGVTSTASTTTINGTVATTGDAATFDNVTLAGNSVIDATGGIETQAITGGGFNLQLVSGNADASIVGTATGLGTVTLMSNASATGLVWFRNSLVATEIVTFAQAYRVRLAESGTTTITNATSFLNTGTLQIGNPGTLATFTGGLTATTGPSSITLAGTITTVNAALALGAVTLADDTTLAGTSVTTAAAVTGGGKSLAITGDAVVGGAIAGVTNYSVSGSTSLGAGVAATGTQAYTGLVTLTADATLSGTTPTFTNGVAGAGYDLVLDFSGTTVITGAAFTGIRNLSTGNGGGTTLSGTLTTGGSQTYGDAVTLAATTTLNGTTPTFTNGVTGAGYDLALDFSGTTVITGAAFTGIRNLSAGNGGSTTLSGTLTTTGNQTFHDDVTLAANTTLDAGTGSILLAGVVSGGFALTPLTSGSGTTTLSGANTNTTTNVVSGVVILANSSPQTTAFVVSGGTLRGTGTVGSLTANGTGVLAPGASPGTIAAGSLALATGAALQIEIAGATAGTGYDQLVVASGGSVNLGGATLGLSATFAPAADSVLTIVDNQTGDPVSGTFAGLPEGSIVSLDTQDYRISYVGGTGNDVTLTALQTDDIVVSVSGESEVVLRLASKGVTISDLRTAYAAKANTVTITAINGGTIFTRSPGIAVNSATGTITVSLAAIPAFAGISIVGGNGTDAITLGPGGVNLAAVAGGGASQSFRIDTGNGATDAIAVTRPIVAKGAGVVALTTAATGVAGGIRLAAPVTTGSGAQTYAGPVVLAANTALASGRDGDITFANTVDGARTLTVNSGGLLRFLGAVGAATPLRGVTVAKAAGVQVADGFALRGAGVATKADGLTIAAGVNNVVFSDTYAGAGRTISGFGGSGIRLAGSSAGSRFAGITSTGNGTGLRVDAGAYATTSITGCSFRESMNAGVSLIGARGLALGTAAAGNSISANAGWGLYASGNLNGTQVHNNSIDGNGKFGVYLEGATGLLLGGTALNTGNRVVNATAWGSYSTGVYATGNLAGTLVQGNTIQANGGNGVTLVNAQRLTIGGPAAGAGNLIDSNGGFGVAASGTCTGSLVQGNLITGNARGTVNVRNAKGIRVV